MNGPSENMNVVLVPLDIKSGDAQANLQNIAAVLHTLPSTTNLVVLPELCTTGFSSDSEKLFDWAESDNGISISGLKHLSEKHNIAICGSFLAKNLKNQLFNRGFIILPSQQTFFYNKRHLFSAGAESSLLTAGESQSPVVTYMTWNLKMAICYDLRFPVWTRNVKLEYDALILPANWPNVRQYAWEHLIEARAIENQAYVLACNREGEDEYGKYSRGDSFVADDFGKIVSSVDDRGIIFATLNAEVLCRNRKHFTPYHDADSFTISVTKESEEEQA